MRFVFPAVALMCHLWDNLLTFGDEFEYIWWRRDWDLSRASFLLIRYSYSASMLYISYSESLLRVFILDF